MFRSTLYKLLFIILILFTNCIAQSFEEGVIALVDTHKITYQQFYNRYADYLVFTGVNDNIVLRNTILNNMINEIILSDYDDNTKIDNDPEYQKEIQWAKNEVKLAYLKDQEIYSKITATDTEIREAYKRSNFKLELRHLYAPTEQAANNLLELLKIGVSFDSLAKQVFTDSLLRNNGGYLGYVTWGDTDPNFEEAAYSLKVGEISKPIKTAQGYSIIKLENKIINPIMTEYDYLNMKPKLERAIKISKKGPYEREYLTELFGKNKIKYDENAIKNIFNQLNGLNLAKTELKTNFTNNKTFCVEYNDKRFTVGEIEQMLFATPSYNLKKLNSIGSIKTAILALLMQKKLLEIAYQRGYDKDITVTEKLNQIANNIFLDYKRNEILNTIPVSDSELYAFYDRNIEYFKSENEMNVQEIVLKDSAKVNLVQKNLAEGEDFGKLARDYSARKWSALNNGEMGLSPVSKFGEFKDTLWNSNVGQIVGPLKIENYFGFFRVLKKEDGKPGSFELLKGKILTAVQNQKGFPYMKKHIEELSKKIRIEINNKLLANLNFNIAG